MPPNLRLGERGGNVSRLTRAQIAKLMPEDNVPNSKAVMRYADDIRTLCEMAVQSLSQESVRSEALEEAAKVCEGLIPKDAGTQFGQWRDEYDAYERCARH